MDEMDDEDEDEEEEEEEEEDENSPPAKNGDSKKAAPVKDSFLL